jgi:hypothetical protein
MMRKFFFVVAALALTSCSYYSDPSQVEGTIVTPSNFIAGTGIIDSVGVLPRARAPEATAGSGRRRPDPHLYRLYIRMDAGGFQSVDVDNSSFAAGQAIELTNDGRIVHVSGMTLNDLRR